MNQSVWNKKIPTFAGLIMLVVTVLVTSTLVRTGILFPIRADISEQPQNVHISNVTDTSFTVFYTTADATLGSVTYGPSETFGSTAPDIRDTTTPQNHHVHYITVKNLQPKTQYQFAIVSGTTTATDNGKPYTVTTSASSTTNKPLSGKIVLSDGTAPKEAVVYIENINKQTVSGLTQADGAYSIDISLLPSAQEYTLIAFGNDQQATATVAAANIATVPPITLSQHYDFSAVIQLETPTTSTAAFPVFSGNKPLNTNPQILTPKKDQAFTDQQPEFTGVAPPNRTVEILIESSHQIKTTVRTNTDGTWSYRPNQPLAPGKHTITMTTRDEAGILRTIVQSFTVNAQGSQFIEPSVSPSTSQSPASPTPSTAPSPTPTPSTSSEPSATPTVSLAPSATLIPTFTPIPTLIPTVFFTQQPTFPLKPPPSEPYGSNDIIIFGGLAAIAIIAGSMLFFVF